jgi:DNA-directed RNA polymerase subunit N (RpoN/RPB10)
MAYIMFKNATITKNINDYVVVDEKYNTYTHEILTNEQLQKLKDILGVSELNEQKEILNDISYINKFEFYGSTR